MLLIYIAHWRFPCGKPSPRIAMRTCEELARRGFEVELWVPWRYNPGFRGIDAFIYHNIKENFTIRRLPAIDLMGFIPGKLSFFLMVASFNVSIFCYAVFRGVARSAIFYCLEFRDIVLLNLLRPNVYFEAHDFYKTPIGWLNRWFFRSARGVIATNMSKMHALEKEFGLPPEGMLHKPCPVDTSMFRISSSREEARSTLGIPQEGKVILYCGQVILWKGVVTLLDAYAFLRPGEVIYFIVGGDDRTVQQFKDQCRKINAANVKIIEGVMHKDIPLWLRAADVLVLPNTGKDPTSKYDTSPLKLFEYMASGKPIVASDLPSIRNIVNEQMVWFFEPDNPAALAGAIHAAFENPRISEEKAARAQEEVEKYTWERRFSDIVPFIHARLPAGRRR